MPSLCHLLWLLSIKHESAPQDISYGISMIFSSITVVSPSLLAHAIDHASLSYLTPFLFAGIGRPQTALLLFTATVLRL